MPREKAPQHHLVVAEAASELVGPEPDPMIYDRQIDEMLHELREQRKKQRDFKKRLSIERGLPVSSRATDLYRFSASTARHSRGESLSLARRSASYRALSRGPGDQNVAEPHLLITDRSLSHGSHAVCDGDTAGVDTADAEGEEMDGLSYGGIDFQPNPSMPLFTSLAVRQRVMAAQSQRRSSAVERLVVGHSTLQHAASARGRNTRVPNPRSSALTAAAAHRSCSEGSKPPATDECDGMEGNRPQPKAHTPRSQAQTVPPTPEGRPQVRSRELTPVDMVSAEPQLAMAEEYHRTGVFSAAPASNEQEAAPSLPGAFLATKGGCSLADLLAGGSRQPPATLAPIADDGASKSGSRRPSPSSRRPSPSSQRTPGLVGVVPRTAPAREPRHGNGSPHPGCMASIGHPVHAGRLRIVSEMELPGVNALQAHFLHQRASRESRCSSPPRRGSPGAQPRTSPLGAARGVDPVLYPEYIDFLEQQYQRLQRSEQETAVLLEAKTAEAHLLSRRLRESKSENAILRRDVYWRLKMLQQCIDRCTEDGASENDEGDAEEADAGQDAGISCSSRPRLEDSIRGDAVVLEEDGRTAPRHSGTRREVGRAVRRSGFQLTADEERLLAKIRGQHPPVAEAEVELNPASWADAGDDAGALGDIDAASHSGVQAPPRTNSPSRIHPNVESTRELEEEATLREETLHYLANTPSKSPSSTPGKRGASMATPVQSLFDGAATPPERHSPRAGRRDFDESSTIERLEENVGLSDALRADVQMLGYNYMRRSGVAVALEAAGGDLNDSRAVIDI